MWFDHILDRHCQQRGDHPAVVDGDRTLTWRELREAAHSLATHLAERGVGHGDRVAVYSRNRAEMFIGFFALARLGAPFVPVNHATPYREYQKVAQRLDLKHVLGEARLLAPLALPEDGRTVFDDPDFERILTGPASPPPPVARMTDPLAVLLTSGTTGEPKGVVQTSEALRFMSLSWLAEVHADDSVRLLNLNSLAHGSITLTSHYLAAGATVHVLREFRPRAALREIQQRDITHVWLVPHMLKFLLAAAGTARPVESRLREILFGASPATPELLAEAMDTFGCAFRNVYGMTEAGGTFCTWKSPPVPAGQATVPLESSGRSVPGIGVEIQDDEGRPLPHGTTGEICVNSAGRMSYYLGDRAETELTIVNGWVRTGDLGYMDEHGYVWIRDRKKDLIKRGGQNVFPAEIEKVIMSHPGVHDAGVVGVPDEQWTEVPVAYVVAEEGATVTTAELRRFLRDRLASYKQPTDIVLVSTIPRNGAGKVLRRKLADARIGHESTGASA